METQESKENNGSKSKRRKPFRVWRTRFFTATRLIVLGFLFIIFAGAALLMIPGATKDGVSINFIDALFTSASATCVTGLSVFSIYDTFSIFGQVIILFLIQLGGLGFMSLTSFLYMAISKKTSLSYRLTLREDITDGNVPQIRRLVSRILILTVVCEGLGACVLSGAYSRYMSGGEAVWNGIFHSVSAFCNAGLDIVGLQGAESFHTFYSDPLVLLPVSILIIVGGLGFIVVSDMWDAKIWKRYKLHTKIVLGMTCGLILAGTAFFLGVEYNNPETLGNMNFGDKLMNAYFQSVTARTAGFSTIDIGAMQPASVVFMGGLMFVGASPGSTGGGIKTTTLFILLVMVYNVIRQRKYAIVDKQTLGAKTINRASSVFVLAVFIMFLTTGLLMLTDGNHLSLQQLLFEQISAYATVGLSLDATTLLSAGGRMIIIICMFLGRIGVLTFFISFTRGRNKTSDNVAFPECSIII